MACGGAVTALIRAHVARVTQRGQALVESMVALFWLIPLWFALLFLAELLAAQQAAISSVRHAVILSHLTDGALPRAEIAAIARSRYGDMSADAPWMPSSLRLQLELTEAKPLPSPKQLHEITQSTLLPAGIVTGGDFRLPTSSGIQARAQWSFRLPDFLAAAQTDTPILLTEQLAALHHGWSSRSDTDTRDHVIGMTVQARLAEATTVFDAVRPVIAIIEPAFERFCPGRLDVDIVPSDRTEGSQGGDARPRPC
ncbi:MAG: hypothetical protein KJS73_03950 [Gammaproteobacteria bacterium]|jgi:hypothetical protein|nr:hypothetical protein [Gammaproteobacteria bacterium]